MQSFFVLLSVENSQIIYVGKEMARSAKNFWIQLPKWLKIAWKLTNLTGFTDQPPTIATFMEVPPQ